jgi:hypothetical protein
MVGDWTRVQQVVREQQSDSLAFAAGNLLLAMKNDDREGFYKCLSAGFLSLGRPITSAGRYSYNSSYETMINLHILHELKLFYEGNRDLADLRRETSTGGLPAVLKGRLDALLPSFKTREAVLSFRRAAHGIRQVPIAISHISPKLSRKC